MFLSSICCQAQAETQWPSPQFSYERNGIYPTRSSKVVPFKICCFHIPMVPFRQRQLCYHDSSLTTNKLWGFVDKIRLAGILNVLRKDIKIRPQTWPLSLGITHIYPPGLDPAKAPARAGAAQAAGAQKKTPSSQLGIGILGCFGKLLLMVQKSG